MTKAPLNTSRKIKRCPFCNGMPDFGQIGTAAGEKLRVVCRICEAEGPTVLAGNLDSDVRAAHLDRAVMLWNRRTP